MLVLIYAFILLIIVLNRWSNSDIPIEITSDNATHLKSTKLQKKKNYYTSYKTTTTNQPTLPTTTESYILKSLQSDFHVNVSGGSNYPPIKNPDQKPSCLDQDLSIEEKTLLADLIFIGKVDWLGGKVRERDSATYNGNRTPGGRIGGVSVLKVLKGSPLISDKELLIEGFEVPYFCHVKSKVHEKWIFLVFKITGKHFGLASSLMRVKRSNIQNIAVALDPMLKDQPQKRKFHRKTRIRAYRR